MQVLVSHPGTQHSLRLAVACDKANVLSGYATQMYWRDDRWPYALLGKVPGIEHTLREKLARRRTSELPDKLIYDLNPWADFALYGLRQVQQRWLAEHFMIATNNLFSRRAARLARRLGADVFVCYDTCSEPGFRMLEGSDVARVLDLAHPHACGYDILVDEARRQPQWSATADAPMYPWLIAQCRREQLLAEHIVVASSFSRACMLRDGVSEHRLSVVPYGVDLTRFVPRSKPQGPLRLLFVGQVGQRKGIAYLLEAMRALEGRNIELTIAGVLIGDPAIYERYASDRIRFVGRVTEDILDSLYAKADVFIFPSLVEGFGLVLLEALASGLPIIASTNCGGPDVIDEGEQGFIVPIRDVGSIVRAVSALDDDRALLQRMKVAARARAEQFTWKRYEERVVEAIRKAHAVKHARSHATS